MIRFSLPAAILLVLALGSFLKAEDGFRLRSLNPFADPAAEIDPPPQPQVIGLPNYRQQGQQGDESLLERVGDGARSTWHHVGAMVRAPFQPLADAHTASHGESHRWFRFPWSEEDRPREPETVGEFMTQPRPRF